jgi:hypothetical protein
MSALKKCRQYWRDNLAAAKEGRKIILLAVLVAWQLVYGSARYWQLFVQPGKIEGAKVFDLCEVFSVAFFAVWVLVWLPFKRHEQEKETSASGMAERERAIHQLESRLDEAQKRRSVLKELGYFHERLGERLREIKGMTAHRFCEENRAAFESRSIDKTTMRLISLIEFFLRLEVKGTSVAVFHDKTSLMRTDVPLSGNREQEMHHRAVIDFVAHYQKQLMKIIKTVS